MAGANAFRFRRPPSESASAGSCKGPRSSSFPVAALSWAVSQGPAEAAGKCDWPRRPPGLSPGSSVVLAGVSIAAGLSFNGAYFSYELREPHDRSSGPS
jgi:hypothetical protein